MKMLSATITEIHSLLDKGFTVTRKRADHAFDYRFYKDADAPTGIVGRISQHQGSDTILMIEAVNIEEIFELDPHLINALTDVLDSLPEGRDQQPHITLADSDYYFYMKDGELWAKAETPLETMEQRVRPWEEA